MWAEMSNDYFDTKVYIPCDHTGCDRFVLQIRNKTSHNIEIDWNRTLYINNGQTLGGFMFEGVVYKDRNNQKPPDIVFGNSAISKSIWPNNLVSYSSGRYGGWDNNLMPPGLNGIYLYVTVDDKIIWQKLMTNIEKR